MRMQLLSGVASLAFVATLPSGSAAQSATSVQPQSWVGEVIVTGVRSTYAAPDATSATRTDTPIIEAPQSVQVITGFLIKEQDARTLHDVLSNVSGVVGTRPEESIFTSPIVRGFPAEIYTDGLPLFGSDQAVNDPTSLVGVSRIEVLKGPTATLYGGGLGTPLGGLINVETERPEIGGGALKGYAAVRVGSYSTVDPYVDVNLPLGPSVAARFAGEYQSQGSWIDRVRGDRWSVQPSLLFQLGPQTDLLLQGRADHRGELEYSGLPASQASVGRIDRNGFPGATSGQPFTTIDNDSATATLRHSFSDSLRLTVTGRHSEVSTQEYGSFVYPAFYPPDPSTPTTYPILPIHLDDKATESTVDANLLFKMADPLSGRHEILGGFDYDHTTFRSNLGFDGVPIGTLDLAHPGGGSIAFGLAPAVSVSQTDRFETVAGYLQDQASYGRLHLTGSVRYTRLGLREREEGTDQAYYRVSPRLGATLDLLSGVALYGGYATGIRAAFAYVGLTPPKPQTSRNYEVGLKLALTRLGVSGTLAAFDQTRRNVPTADPNDIHFSIQTGEQRARGGEADLVWEPTPALSVLANYAYTEAEVTQDSAIPVGDKLPRVPRNSGRIAARYRVLNGVAKGLSFGGGITAFDSRALTLPNTVSVPGYATVDAQAAYDFGRFTVEVSAINLNGSKAFDAYEYLGFPVVIPIQPRSAYVTLKTRF